MVVGKLPRGAISLTGNIHTGSKKHSGESETEPVVVWLRIVAKEKIPELASYPQGVACVYPLEGPLLPFLGGFSGAGTLCCFLALSSGSDCVLTAHAAEAVPPGCIALDEGHLHNLHAAEGEAPRSFSPFTMPSTLPFALHALTLEVKLRERAQHPQEVDGGAATREVSQRLFGRILAVGEVVPLTLGGVPLVLRVTQADTLSPEEQAELPIYHSFRGLLTADTQVYIEGGEGVEVQGQQARPLLADGRTGHLVHVTTSDGEWFPVKKKLLRPCIALTQAVQDKDPMQAPQVKVQVACLDFDRVVMFLEAEAAGRAGDFNVDINQVESLLAAAHHLKCRPLENFCNKMLGDFKSRIREYTFEEVKRANASGKVWILVDFMVLDVTDWLPEHPGGRTIIPAQALNLDATCFFELYHVSKESFMYLRQFYIGEVCQADRELVPRDESASEHFIQQLQEFSAFRIKIKPLASNFHLGFKA